MVSNDATCVCVCVCMCGPYSPIMSALQEEITMGSVIIAEYIKNWWESALAHTFHYTSVQRKTWTDNMSML